MTLLGYNPTTVIVDPKTGRLTRDGQIMWAAFVNAINGAGAVLTNDGAQTLTNKTISGNRNTLTDIATASLEETTGDGPVVTGSAGADGRLAVWGAGGNLGSGDAATDYLKTTQANSDYLRVDGVTPMDAPLILANYAVASVPDATVNEGGIIYVPDETGGACVALSNGTDWVRIYDPTTAIS